MIEGVGGAQERTRVLLDGLSWPTLVLAEEMLPDSRYEVIEVIGTGREIGEDLGSILGWGSIGLRVTSRSAARTIDAQVSALSVGDDSAELLSRARWALERRMDVLVLETGAGEHGHELAKLHEAAMAAERRVIFVNVAAGEERPEKSLLGAIASIQTAPPGLAGSRE